jgi:hypothetical protein
VLYSRNTLYSRLPSTASVDAKVLLATATVTGPLHVASLNVDATTHPDPHGGPDTANQEATGLPPNAASPGAPGRNPDPAAVRDFRLTGPRRPVVGRVPGVAAALPEPGDVEIGTVGGEAERTRRVGLGEGHLGLRSPTRSVVRRVPDPGVSADAYDVQGTVAYSECRYDRLIRHDGGILACALHLVPLYAAYQRCDVLPLRSHAA